MSVPRRVAALGLGLLTGMAPVFARVYMSQEKALEIAFGGGAAVRREARFLTDAQIEEARRLAGPGVAVESALVTRYVGSRDGAVLGTAYFDTHPVRTLQETVMVVVRPERTVDRVEVVAFGEPEDYLPRERWYRQFPGRALDSNLAVHRGIHGITGATLSARATTDAVRRILSIHAAIEDGGAAQ